MRKRTTAALTKVGTYEAKEEGESQLRVRTLGSRGCGRAKVLLRGEASVFQLVSQHSTRPRSLYAPLRVAVCPPVGVVFLTRQRGSGEEAHVCCSAVVGVVRAEKDGQREAERAKRVSSLLSADGTWDCCRSM